MTSCPGIINTTRLEPYDAARVARSVSRLLEQVGLAIPHHISEWNLSGPPPSPFYHNARGAAWTASVLSFLQDTDVAIALRYRANSGRDTIGDESHGAWFLDGRYKKPAYAFLAHRRLLETPHRLLSTGADTAGYAVLAGKSADNRAVTVLISDVKNGYDGYTLTVRNLPFPDTFFTYSRYELDSIHDFVPVEERSVSGSSFTAGVTLNAPAVHLLRLSAGVPGITESPLRPRNHFPGPDNDRLLRRWPVYDATGRLVRTIPSDPTAGTSDLLNGLPTGCYFIRRNITITKIIKPK